ncbi:hypothetical protein [Actinokineospora diospyrosa]|uniref:Mce-associated membrane protein n=1 Tax=Actinokineospora diospyrosa TaxID=103728 RepID=A0ABT1I7P2_9PSEU|nr:hypothetical protein [Actinokineospora diospyrosa]MCP2268608.1 hypothetical protein [Actinokineospora diospyrosa]
MTSKCRRTAALLSITALAFTGVAATASADTGATEAHLTTIAREYLQDRATTLVGGTTARPAALTDRMADRATSVDAWVSGARDNLAKHGVRYGSAKVDLTVAKSDIKSNTATLHLHEVTTLAPARGAENPATSYAVDRVVTFQRTDRWRLDEQELDAAANTLAPITERPDVARTGTAVVEQHDAAPGTRPVAAEVGKRSSATPAAKRDSVTAAASYCYSCMENYARQYWDHYNDNDYRT